MYLEDPDTPLYYFCQPLFVTFFIGVSRECEGRLGYDSYSYPNHIQVPLSSYYLILFHMRISYFFMIFAIYFGFLSMSIVPVDANTYPIVPKNPILCTMQYAPVCGYTPIQCITTPCEPIRQTYGNSCMAGAAGAIEITQ